MEAPEFYAKDRAAWRAWLEKNHQTQQAVWLVFDKGAGRSLQWEDIVQEALCFGWIDSRPGKVSETQSKIYVSRRKPKSVWSKVNKGHVAKLTAQGLIKPAGQQAIDLAQKNGSWDALNNSDNLILPPELSERLTQNTAAKVFFEGLSSSSKRVILEWIYAAKTEPTRLRRIVQTVELSAQGIKAR